MFHTFAVPKTRRGSSLKLFGNNKEGKREGREFTPVNDRPTMRRLTQLSPKRNEKREHSSRQKETKKGSIAQLVQSVCLTSRGSGVRLPLLPPKTKKQPDFQLAASLSSWEI